MKFELMKDVEFRYLESRFYEPKEKESRILRDYRSGELDKEQALDKIEQLWKGWVGYRAEVYRRSLDRKLKEIEKTQAYKDGSIGIFGIERDGLREIEEFLNDYKDRHKLKRRLASSKIDDIDKKVKAWEDKVLESKKKREAALKDAKNPRVVQPDDRIKALATLLGCSEESVGDAGDYFKVSGEEPREYLVLTDEEATESTLESLKDSIEECYLAEVELPKFFRDFFDMEACVQHLLEADGRGHTLAGYDGEELIAKTDDGLVFFVYRVN